MTSSGPGDSDPHISSSCKEQPPEISIPVSSASNASTSSNRSSSGQSLPSDDQLSEESSSPKSRTGRRVTRSSSVSRDQLNNVKFDQRNVEQEPHILPGNKSAESPSMEKSKEHDNTVRAKDMEKSDGMSSSNSGDSNSVSSNSARKPDRRRTIVSTPPIEENLNNNLGDDMENAQQQGCLSSESNSNQPFLLHPNVPETWSPSLSCPDGISPLARRSLIPDSQETDPYQKFEKTSSNVSKGSQEDTVAEAKEQNEDEFDVAHRGREDSGKQWRIVSDCSMNSSSGATKFLSHSDDKIKVKEHSSGFQSESSGKSQLTKYEPSFDEPEGHYLSRKVETSKSRSRSSSGNGSLGGVSTSQPEKEEELIEAALDGDVDTVNRLLDEDVNIEAFSHMDGMEGLTALHAASWSGEDKVVKLLLERKANRKALANGLSAVHYAAKGGHVSVLQLLWDAGSIIRNRTAEGSSPLHLAADNGNLEAVKWLVDKGALLHSKDKRGFTPEDLVRESGYKDVAKFLHEKNKELRMNDLSEKRTLGKGAYGEVFLVKRNGKPLVLKSVNLSQLFTKKKMEYALQEIKLLKSLTHPYIVSYMGGGCKGEYLYILMEYCSGGDLYKRIEEQKKKKIPFQEQQIVNWCLRLGIAIKYIHGHKILHRDIKPQNIFLTGDNVIKLGDFGLSKVLKDESQACTSIGSPAYMSPEVFQGQPYDTGADMWAFGSVMFEMTALKIAYPHKKLEMPNFSQAYQDAVMSLLQRDPQQRLSADKLLRLPIFHDALESQLAEQDHHITELNEEINSLTHDIEDYMQEIEVRDTALEDLKRRDGSH